MKRGGPLKRKKLLKRGGRLKVKTPMKKINAKRGGKRFPKNVNKAYRVWIMGQPCFIAQTATPDRPAMPHQCMGDVVPAHVKSQGAGGVDEGNIIPLDYGEHGFQHSIGIVTWAKRYGLTVADLKRVAQQYWLTYERSVLGVVHL